MLFIRVGGVALLSGLLLSACVAPGGNMGGIGGPWVNPWVPQQPPVYAQPDVEIYKYQGSRQCEGGGVPLAAMHQQLQMAGVQVKGSSCGMDGRMYAAFCGGADGKINIFTVSADTANLAYSQGFFPLNDLQGAQRTSCYVGNNNMGNNAGGTVTYPYSGTSGDTSYYTYRLKP